MRLLLKNLHCYSEGREWCGDIRIAGGKILEHGRGLKVRRGEQQISLSGYLALPGLINGHDHLELNLYPRLGNPPYSNFSAWAQDIYYPDRPPISEIQRVLLADRLWWSAYKNLISGVTTVVHHDPYHRHIFQNRFPINVLKRYGWAHSLGRGDNVQSAFARARGKPFIIHAAEGTDPEAQAEIERLDELSVLSSNTVIVHGIGLRPDTTMRLSEVGTSIVWCPSSNVWLYGKTAPIDQLKGCVKLALGTDSTLSGAATLLDELRAARDSGLAKPAELLEMVTTGAASIFGLKDGRGTLRESAPADLLLLPDTAAAPPHETLLQAAPADVTGVFVGGKPRLADCYLAESLDLAPPTALVESIPKWVYGSVGALRLRIEHVVPAEILARSPLWNILEGAI